MDPKAVDYINNELKTKKEFASFKSIIFFGIGVIFSLAGLKYLKQSCKYDGAMKAFTSVRDDDWED